MATRSAEQPWCPFPQQHPLALPRGSVTAPRHCGRCSSSGVSLVLPPCVLLLLLLRRSLALSVIIVETVQTNHPLTNCQSSCQRALKKQQKKQVSLSVWGMMVKLQCCVVSSQTNMTTGKSCQGQPVPVRNEKSMLQIEAIRPPALSFWLRCPFLWLANLSFVSCPWTVAGDSSVIV